MADLVFNTKDDMLFYVNCFANIGFGSQGTCFVDYNRKLVYKIFNEYLDEDIYDPDFITLYNKDEIIKFTTQNSLCLWPCSTIIAGNTICGYVSNYVNAKNLFKINPLMVNLNSLSLAYLRAKDDIKKISLDGICFFDVMYNILYNGKQKRFYVVDSMDFSFSDKSFDDLYLDNLKMFGYELKYFLIDGYFDEFISSIDSLNEMYKLKDFYDIEVFLNLFRECLNREIGHNINRLCEAKPLINNKKYKRKYERYV